MTTEQQTIKEEVRKRYGKAAERAREKSADASCCGTASTEDVITSSLYTTDELADLPNEAVIASLGCGNPVAVADLHAGETVLDLGSGGGIDVILSARRVGPTGRAYGLDMTDQMLDLARENAKKAGVANTVFVKGEMEDMPLPNNEVDVIISNCVVNLSPDKDAVLREAYRVLKPGGRIAISDIVAHKEVPAELKKSLEVWAGCVAGALVQEDYVAKLEAAGFEDVDIESLPRVHRRRRRVRRPRRDRPQVREGRQRRPRHLQRRRPRARKPGGVANGGREDRGRGGNRRRVLRT